MTDYSTGTGTWAYFTRKLITLKATQWVYPLCHHIVPVIASLWLVVQTWLQERQTRVMILWAL